ncbi:hypothetical protein [Halosolutus gelatinilyticus]|uniref:hypothetical protein n=1 Tax=Halosolutus gelatinilyticus TaxID=2931975 RepID=UPI001FF3FB98|nr:hypothetical protein [Halosolutus gelatinilyticus]
MTRREYLQMIGTAALGSVVAGCGDIDLLPSPEPQDIETRVTDDRFQTRRNGGR